MALTDKLKAIGNAIRSKTGKSEPLTLSQMVAEIEGISAGGGAARLQTKRVTPSTSDQEVTPDSDYDGMSSVLVGKIPSQYADVSAATATPDKILSGFTAGLASGLQSGTLKIATGTITLSSIVRSTTGSPTINHGLGVVPKTIIAYVESGWNKNANYNTTLYAECINRASGAWPAAMTGNRGSITRMSTAGSWTTTGGGSGNYCCDSITASSFRLRTASTSDCWNSGCTVRWIAIAI